MWCKNLKDYIFLKEKSYSKNLRTYVFYDIFLFVLVLGVKFLTKRR